MSLRRLIAAAGISLALILPVLTIVSPVKVFATDTSLDCKYIGENQVQYVDEPIAEEPVCDLGLDKQVSVNGGAFQDADTSAAAVTAQVGDTVTWKITLTNNSSENYMPQDIVYITDVLPSGLSLESYVASSGYFSSNTWEVYLNGEATSLPATLTLTTKVTVAGLKQNTAAFSDYDYCSDGCMAGNYTDDDSTNDSDSAWITAPATPRVLGETDEKPQVKAAVLANTGSKGNGPMIAAASLIIATIVLGYATRRREQN